MTRWFLPLFSNSLRSLWPGSIRCWKPTSKVLVPHWHDAPHNFCRFVSYTFMLLVSCRIPEVFSFEISCVDDWASSDQSEAHLFCHPGLCGCSSIRFDRWQPGNTWWHRTVTLDCKRTLNMNVSSSWWSLLSASLECFWAPNEEWWFCPLVSSI